MKLDNWLAQRAQSCPERTALVTQGSSVTYAELEAEGTWVARRLAAYGVRREGTAALTMQPRREEVVLLHALMKLGATALPLSPQLTEAERAAVLGSERPAVDLNDAAELTQTEADLPLLGEHDMDDLCCRILTSGTAGEPRPVGLTYGNFLFSAVGSAFNIGVDPGDRWLCCLPLSHVAGLSIILRSVIYGTTAVLLDGFDTEQVASTLVSGEISLLSLVPTQLIRLLEAGADLSRPRAILIGGGPVPPDALDEALGRGATLVQTYGMTETCSQVTTLAPDDAERKVGSAGRPLLTTHVRIEAKEILVQGPTVAPGCYEADGWLHTGDLGHIDEEGFLYVNGRRSEVIVTGGENVMPAEVEAVLLAHPSVADAAVVGRPDPEWQEAVCALVVVADGKEASDDELRSHCAASLAPFKVPKRVDFVSGLPRSPSGKLIRGDLVGL
ncbi:MAG TPA: o-succinylbenzoate--CoA ligase [Solirubrobacterales bacterium]